MLTETPRFICSWNVTEYYFDKSRPCGGKNLESPHKIYWLCPWSTQLQVLCVVPRRRTPPVIWPRRRQFWILRRCASLYLGLSAIKWRVGAELKPRNCSPVIRGCDRLSWAEAQILSFCVLKPSKYNFVRSKNKISNPEKLSSSTKIRLARLDIDR